jgi:BirA family biotin operon repressor/biotin-[acetyl-CoA-carboxylase] ligase
VPGRILPAGLIRLPAAPGPFLASVLEAMGQRSWRATPATVLALPEFWHGLVLVGHSPCSQYDALRTALAAIGPPRRNLACVALTGDRFHGQHERPWAAVAGNLHLSAVIACDLPAAAFAPIMPALPAGATVEAVAALGGGQLQPRIKWVNDVLVDGCKLAGSLTAVRTRQGRIQAVVLGIGLNVAVAPAVAPAVAGDRSALPSVSLQTLLPAESPGLGAALSALLQAVADRCEDLQANGPASLLAAYRRWSAVIGQAVVVRPEGATDEDPGLSGVVQAIGPDLALHLAGHDEPVTSGRLTLSSPRPSTGT